MAYKAEALAALADPTRRQIFERLRAGPRAVGELAKGMPISRPAVSQHLQVLKSAGLVTDEAQGTRRVYQIDPKGLCAIRRWLDQFWDQQLEAFAAEVDRKEEQHMNTTIAPAPVRRSVRVKAKPEKAFDIFTARMGGWWLKSHSINASPQKEIVMEPRPGGRWFERGEDGSECQWGHVLAWEPPKRVLLAWQIGGDWKFDPNLVTELEVRFIPESSGTRVELEHRNIERFGDHAEAVRAAFESPEGWGGLLESFASIVDDGPQS